MSYREKVIKGLELCEIGSDDRCYETECPYYVQGCTESLKNDILVLLKKQEAKIPSIMQDMEGIWSTCPTCGNKLRAILAMKMDTYFPKYCQECGQEVKWE